MSMFSYRVLSRHVPWRNSQASALIHTHKNMHTQALLITATKQTHSDVISDGVNECGTVGGRSHGAIVCSCDP